MCCNCNRCKCFIGLPGPAGPPGPPGPAGECDCGITQLDNCYVFTANDGTQVLGCIERQGQSDQFKWDFVPYV